MNRHPASARPPRPASTNPAAMRSPSGLWAFRAGSPVLPPLARLLRHQHFRGTSERRPPVPATPRCRCRRSRSRETSPQGTVKSAAPCSRQRASSARTSASARFRHPASGSASRPCGSPLPYAHPPRSQPPSRNRPGSPAALSLQTAPPRDRAARSAPPPRGGGPATPPGCPTGSAGSPRSASGSSSVPRGGSTMPPCPPSASLRSPPASFRRPVRPRFVARRRPPEFIDPRQRTAEPATGGSGGASEKRSAFPVALRFLAQCRPASRSASTLSSCLGAQHAVQLQRIPPLLVQVSAISLRSTRTRGRPRLSGRQSRLASVSNSAATVLAGPHVLHPHRANQPVLHQRPALPLDPRKLGQRQRVDLPEDGRVSHVPLRAASGWRGSGLLPQPWKAVPEAAHVSLRCTSLRAAGCQGGCDHAPPASRRTRACRDGPPGLPGETRREASSGRKRRWTCRSRWDPGRRRSTEAPPPRSRGPRGTRSGRCERIRTSLPEFPFGSSIRSRISSSPPARRRRR